MELSQSLICRGAFGFSQPRTRKRKKEDEKFTVKTLPAKEVASFICFGGKKTVKYSGFEMRHESNVQDRKLGRTLVDNGSTLFLNLIRQSHEKLESEDCESLRAYVR